jgi:allantoicase
MTEFADKYVNLASPKLGCEVVFATDDSFAAKERMIQDHDPIWVPDKYDTYGKWMDGWESKRRRDGRHDWAILKLGVMGVIEAVDIDTSHFTGNYPPAVMIEVSASEDQPTKDSQWFTILAPTSLGPNASHVREVSYNQPVNWLRVHMLPDGGIARLRVYGKPFCDWSTKDPDEIHELSLMVNGARVLGYNDAHYGKVWSILTEGRGENMGDGWETRRRREPGNDWVVVSLGQKGTVERIEVDTCHFKGNFPESCAIDAACVDFGTTESIITQSMIWGRLMERKKLSADTIHTFTKEDLNEFGPITHVRLNIYPDGGISRFRVFGKLAD